MNPFPIFILLLEYTHENKEKVIILNGRLFPLFPDLYQSLLHELFCWSIKSFVQFNLKNID